MVDFNSIFEPNKRINGHPVTIHELKDGNECIQKLEFNFVNGCGQEFSWSKRGECETRICSRTNHCLDNNMERVMFSTCYLAHLNIALFIFNLENTLKGEGYLYIL